MTVCREFGGSRLNKISMLKNGIILVRFDTVVVRIKSYMVVFIILIVNHS